MFFEACRTAGIPLNMKKTQSGNSVIFASYQIDEEGAKLDPTLYKAIADFPVPNTLTELRFFPGSSTPAGAFHISDFRTDRADAPAVEEVQ